HEAVDARHLVRMRSGRHGDLSKLATVAGIADINNGCAVGAVHVTDVGDPFGNHDLPAAWTIEIPNLADTNCCRHGTSPCHSGHLRTHSHAIWLNPPPARRPRGGLAGTPGSRT